MDIISIAIGAALLGVAGVFVYRPFQGKRLKRQGHEEAAAQPQARRESLLSALRDLEQGAEGDSALAQLEAAVGSDPAEQ